MQLLLKGFHFTHEILAMKWCKQAFMIKQDRHQENYENTDHFSLVYQMNTPKLRLYWKGEKKRKHRQADEVTIQSLNHMQPYENEFLMFKT